MSFSLCTAASLKVGKHCVCPILRWRFGMYLWLIEDCVEPIYISETVERTMNPTFRHVDFSACGAAVTRLGHVIVRVWVRGVVIGKRDESHHPRRWRLFMEMEVALTNLQFLGKSVRCVASRSSLPYNISRTLKAN